MYIKVTEMKKGLSYRLSSRVIAPSVVSIMLSVEQSYSRLFRPWDMSSDSKKSELKTSIPNDAIVTDVNAETAARKRKSAEVKRENRLRKIRGTFKKPDSNVHQDATVSTTTGDEDKHNIDIINVLNSSEIPEKSPVTNLSIVCDRLLQEPEKAKPKTKDTIVTCPVEKSLPVTKPFYSPSGPQFSPSMYPSHPGFMPDYLPTADIAQALGVPPSDPLLLESLAQGYAMELEYARILQQENEAKLLNARKQRPKKYKCPHCQVGFSNNGQLKGHIRIHTGERPYKCDEKNCGKSFTRNEELTRHKRIHSGVRPFPCPTCGKKFGRRDHLKKHTRTHFLQAERMMPVFVPLSSMPHGFPYLYGY